MNIFTHERAISATKITVAIALLALSAQAKFYLGPVPSTLQTYALFVLAYALSARAACAMVLGYIACGALGLPVFANGSFALFGASGGYIWGFLPAAFVMGACAHSTSFARIGLHALAASAAIYICGLAQLALFVPASELFALGLKPFIATDLLKAALAALTIAKANKFLTFFK